MHRKVTGPWAIAHPRLPTLTGIYGAALRQVDGESSRTGSQHGLLDGAGFLVGDDALVDQNGKAFKFRDETGRLGAGTQVALGEVHAFRRAGSQRRAPRPYAPMDTGANVECCSEQRVSAERFAHSIASLS